MGVNNNISLGIGNCSISSELGPYYQNLKPAIFHFENNNLGLFDKNGIPYLVEGDRHYYSVIYVIQYALIQFEFIYSNDKVQEREEIVKRCLNWIISDAEEFKGCMIWRSEANHHYGLEKGWISSMYQGQALSLFLRAYQHFNDQSLLDYCHKIFPFFEIDYSEGGVRRTDSRGYTWFEEYPTKEPSFVLNGFIYTVLGILDYYRVTNDQRSKSLYEDCIETLKHNVHKYHRFYWSVYDQLKLELVSYYYQKNVHIPLMGILHELTGETIFDYYQKKWTRQLNNRLYRFLVTIMYRLQPRFVKYFK